MIASLLSWIALSYRAPREAAARLLAAGPSLRDAILMILAGTVLVAAVGLAAELIAGRSLEEAKNEGMELILAKLDPPEEVQGTTAVAPPPLAEALMAGVAAIAQGAIFMLVTALAVLGLGKIFGGKAGLTACLAVTGLSSIVRAPAVFLAVFAMVGLPPEQFEVAVPIWLGLELLLLYQFSAFIAEAHGFRSVAPVMGVALGVTLTIALIIVALALGQIATQPG